jgi:Raf kinase inhibitor-like YbhB/YbcL family protein
MCRHLYLAASILVLASMASCGADDGVNRAEGAKTMDNATIARLNLTSDAFQNGQPIPRQYTCDGADQTPALTWGEPPPGTRSFALVIDDPDAPSGTFRHWGVYDIPASARSIGGGSRTGSEATNDFGKRGYGGPCPPTGHGPHHYHFKLFALSVDELGLPANPKVLDVETAAKKHAIAEGELIGTYERR